MSNSKSVPPAGAYSHKGHTTLGLTEESCGTCGKGRKSVVVSFGDAYVLLAFLFCMFQGGGGRTVRLFKAMLNAKWLGLYGGRTVNRICMSRSCALFMPLISNALGFVS